MALGSLSIDNLLPAFEPIRQSFGVPDANEMQLHPHRLHGGLRGDADRLGAAFGHHRAGARS